MEELEEGQTEGAERDGNPIGKSIVSINLNPWEFPETKPSTKQQKRADPAFPTPIHICRRGLPCQASVKKDVLNFVDLMPPGNGDRGTLLEAKETG